MMIGEIRTIGARAEKQTDFPTAIRAVTAGRKITRAEWGDDEYYGVLRDGLLMLHKPDGFYQWIINDGDLMGKDWQAFD